VLILVIAVGVGAVVFGVMTLLGGGDPGLRHVEADSRARPLPGDRPLAEGDVGYVAFDLALRGYRMDQVDKALQRLAYDIGYKSELIGVLEAEIAALREGRDEDADTLARARAASLAGRSSTKAEPASFEVTQDLSIELSSEVPPVEADEADLGALEETPDVAEKKSEVV
jgi:DivIVA domain-containing protein